MEKQFVRNQSNSILKLMKDKIPNDESKTIITTTTTTITTTNNENQSN